jgi:hypothetical protein
MKKFSLFFSSLLIAALLNAQAPAVTPAQTPDITKVLDIKDTNHDFGKIPYGKPAEYDVVIKNVSNDSIKIENVKVGCGCTTPKYEVGKSYGPGETFKVTLGFNGYTDGPFTKYADIVFSNGLSKQVTFTGTGYKVPEQAAPANGAVQKMKTNGNK